MTKVEKDSVWIEKEWIFVRLDLLGWLQKQPLLSLSYEKVYSKLTSIELDLKLILRVVEIMNAHNLRYCSNSYESKQYHTLVLDA